MAAGRLWVLSDLLGRWEQHNYKFGGPRGGWSAAACAHKQRCGLVAGGARDTCRAVVACEGPPGALGAGRRAAGVWACLPRTTPWSRQGKPETLGLGESS